MIHNLEKTIKRSLIKYDTLPQNDHTNRPKSTT